MDGFSGYNQIQIKPEEQHKTTFICPWGTFAYRKMPFGLKNAGATFQRAMSFSFHDLKHIVEAYLDDLASRSRKRTDHPTHLRLIFERCRYFQSRLNPNKCSFCVTSGRLSGLIVSTTRIMVNPLKVEAIIQLPPPPPPMHNPSTSESTRQGEIFMMLHRQLCRNHQGLYALTEALKHALTTTPLLWPPKYNKDFLLYLAIGESTIGMVLVQEYDLFSEYMIYYLR
jgi:hypothetical protein